LRCLYPCLVATPKTSRLGERVLPSGVLSADLYSDGSLRDIKLAVYADVPGLSIASCSLVPMDRSEPPDNPDFFCDPGNLIVRSRFFEIRFDPQSGIHSLQDRRTGRELLQTEKRRASLAGKIDGEDVESKGTWVLRRGQGGASWAVACETDFVASIPYTLQMKVCRDIPRIDCTVRFRFDGQRISRLSPDKRDSVSGFVDEDELRFKLFPAVGKDVVGVRDLPIAISETQDRCVNGLYWTAMTDNENGVAFFNRGTMGALRESDGGFSMPLAYAMYYVWGTRMLNGEFVYEFAVFPFTGPWQEADLHRRAIEYNDPLVGLAAEAGNGRQGHTIQPVVIEPADTTVSALYPMGDDFYIRLVEHEGRRRQVAIQYMMGKADLTEVSLAGQSVGPLSSSIDAGPWRIKTVRIRPRAD
jgi:alpha-mannosidase